jgi:hypothetical protein
MDTSISRFDGKKFGKGFFCFDCVLISSITDISEVNDCWTGDWESYEFRFLFVVISGEYVTRCDKFVWIFICWQSKLNAERLFNGRIWTISVSSCCSSCVKCSDGEIVAGIIER